MAETMKLIVDTGSVVFDLEDAKGRNLGQIEIIPTDSYILRRYKVAAENLGRIKISENPTEDEIMAVSDTVKEQLNYLMNYDISTSVFSVCGPLTVVASGDFFFEDVLEKISVAIEKIMKKRVEKKMERVKKATAKYHA